MDDEWHEVGVYLGVIHMFTSKPSRVTETVRYKPHWIIELVLASKNNIIIDNELDNIVKNLIY